MINKKPEQNDWRPKGSQSFCPVTGTSVGPSSVGRGDEMRISRED
jgi:hypothetical protein